MIYPGFMVSDYISEKYGQLGKFLVGVDWFYFFYRHPFRKLKQAIKNIFQIPFFSHMIITHPDPAEMFLCFFILPFLHNLVRRQEQQQASLPAS